MTEYLMRVIGVAGYGYDGALEVPDPAYVAEVDLEFAHGRGRARLTENRSEAIRYPSKAAVFEAWRASPESRPVRDDGKPNRPLTAYSITPEPVSPE